MEDSVEWEFEFLETVSVRFVGFFVLERGFGGEEFEVFEEDSFNNDKETFFLLVAGHPEKEFPKVIFFVEVLDV
jgi:hypothetical protein